MQNVLNAAKHAAGTTTAAAAIEVDSSDTPSVDWPKDVIYSSKNDVIYVIPLALPAETGATEDAQEKALSPAPEPLAPSSIEQEGPDGEAGNSDDLSSGDAAAHGAAQAPHAQVSSFQEKAAPAPTGAGLQPEAVCRGNKPLVTSPFNRFKSDCRAYLFISPNSYVRCSAWFVDGTHVALAGHCVANAGAGKYKIVKVAGAFGQVCCSPNASDEPSKCAADARFAVTGAVTTNGWGRQGSPANDAAVLKVQRFRTTNQIFGKAVKWGALRDGVCNTMSVRFGGFPVRDTASAGCNLAFNGRMLYELESAAASKCTIDLAGKATCHPCAGGNDGSMLGYPGSACPGMDGGGLVSSRGYFGILTRWSTKCSGRQASTAYFVVLVDDRITTGGGVNMAHMVAALK